MIKNLKSVSTTPPSPPLESRYRAATRSQWTGMVRHLTLDNQLEGYCIAGGAATTLIYVNNKRYRNNESINTYRSDW